MSAVSSQSREQKSFKSALGRQTLLLIIVLALFNCFLLSVLGGLLIGIEQHWLNVPIWEALQLTRTTLIAGVVGNTILALAFGAYFNKRIVSRLELLLANIDAVASGAKTEALTGSDEIYQIDSSFRKIADSLKELTEQQRAILDYASDVICCFDLSGKCISINSSCKRLWGYDPSDLIDQNLFELILPSDRQRFGANVLSVHGKAGPGNYELRMMKKDGTFAETLWSLHWSSERSWIVAVIHDITERKMRERAEAEFTAMISHDVRSPLATIQMYFQSIETELWGAIPDLYKTHVQKAKKLIEHLLGITEGILEYEKLGAADFTLQRTNVELGKVIEDAVYAVSGQAAQKGIKISSKPCSVKLNADGKRLTQVLTNLLTNAIKYNPDTEPIKIEVVDDATFVTLQVIDKGPGVSDDQKAHIFEKFAQASSPERKDGTGLGLAIAKLIIGGHGGRMGVTDGQTGGSIFWFKIPKRPW